MLPPAERMIASPRCPAGGAVCNDGQRRVGRPSALGRGGAGWAPLPLLTAHTQVRRTDAAAAAYPFHVFWCQNTQRKLSITDLGWWVGINYAGARCGPADEQQRSNNRHGNTQSKRMNGSLCCLLIAGGTHVGLLAIVSGIRAWALKLPMPRLPTELTDPLS